MQFSAAFTARAFGDHGQAITYSAIAAEQAVRHTACFLRREEQRLNDSDSDNRPSLSSLFDEHPLELLREVGAKLGFEPDPSVDDCPDEVRAWRVHIAGIRNKIMHTGYYPTGRESDDATAALGDLTHYLRDRIIDSAHRYPISALVVCDPKQVADPTTRAQVLDLADNLDDYVQEYSGALTR